MKRRYWKGQITIMAALVFGLMSMLMVVLMESIIHTGVRTKANSAVNLGTQSLFSQYSKPLLKKYEVFGGVISESEEVLSSLYSYIYANCVSGGGNDIRGRIFAPLNLSIQDLVIEEQKYLTDDNGEPLYDEITNYMLYGQFDNELYEVLPDLINASREKSINAVNKELKARQKEAARIDGKILKLLMYVEGIKTTSSGFKQSFGHLCSAGEFVKKVCVQGTSFGQTGVNHDEVYGVVKDEYVDLMEELDGLKADLDWIILVYNAPGTKGLFLDIGFRNHTSQLAFAVDDSLTKTKQSLNLIEQIEEDTGKLLRNLGRSKNVLEQYRGQLDEDAATGFEQEFDELGMYGDGTANTLCDLSDVKEKLMLCQGQLETMKTALVALAGTPMDINSIGSVYGEVDACKEICSTFVGHTIQFNYEGVSLGKGSSLAIIEKIQDTFSGGFLQFVLGNKEVSSKSIAFYDLSSQVKYSGNSTWSVSFDPEIMYQDYLYNKYVSMNFSSFLSPNSEGLLEYEMEYILGDSMSDQTNLKSTITQLIHFRFLMNFSHMIQNVEKKGKCKAMAVTLLGFTGVHGVIKLGQYLLMSAWTYGEAINDAKILLDGGKVPLVKTVASWHTNLEDIVEGKISSDTNANPSGLDYTDYLQLLLFLENKTRKIYRTMDMMEVNMIHDGYDHSRMYRYLYSLKGSVLFRYLHGNGEYLQEFEYAY